MWYLTVATEETGGKHKMKIFKKLHWAHLMIGREETFDEMERHHNKCFYQSKHYRSNTVWGRKGLPPDEVWKMETAVEPEE